MTVNIEQKSQQSTGRFSARQKFWLFGVGLPVLLMICLLALVVFLPKPLNPTERKLLGRWEVVEPDTAKGVVIEFDRHYTYSLSHPCLWKVDDNRISLVATRGSDTWMRLKLVLGISKYKERYSIEVLNDHELQVGYGPGSPPMQLRRLNRP